MAPRGVGMQDSTFDAIVADFYKAATGALSWDRALDGVQQAFTARAALLHTLDLGSGQLISLHHGGLDLSDAILSYVREYHAIDPRRNHALQLGPACLDQWVHDHEVFDSSYVANDRFFQHYLPAYGTRYNSNVVLGVGGAVATAFVLELPANRGFLNAEERDVARRLGVHLRDALHAYERVRHMAAQALAGHGLLGTFPYPMWLIDEERFIAFENDAATAELQSEACAGRRGVRLVLTRGRTDQRLTEQLHALYRGVHGASKVVDLRGTTADPPTWLHLSLLVPGAVLGAFGQRPLVLATLFDPAHVNPLDTFALANIFGLTPTEAKVAARMADGQTAAQIGQAHGTTINTVRSQVRQVITKLGASRATDVVRLLRQGEALWSTAGAARV